VFEYTSHDLWRESRTGRWARVGARKKVESQENNLLWPGVCQILSHLTSRRAIFL